MSDKTPSTTSRRRFLQGGLAATAGSALLTSTRPNALAKPVGANDRLRIAVAGLNGRGNSHMGGWLGQKNVEIAYVIDPDDRVLTSALSNLKKKGQNPKGVMDVRMRPGLISLSAS